MLRYFQWIQEPPTIVTSVANAVWRRVPAGQRVRFRKLVRQARRRLSPPKVNPLAEYFWANNGRLIHKWDQYFDIYHRHFAPYRGKRVNVLEFGVSHGGSLQMWKDYFGRRAHITGVDIAPRCAQLAEDRIDIVIGDQVTGNSCVGWEDSWARSTC